MTSHHPTAPTPSPLPAMASDPLDDPPTAPSPPLSPSSPLPHSHRLLLVAMTPPPTRRDLGSSSGSSNRGRDTPTTPGEDYERRLPELPLTEDTLAMATTDALDAEMAGGAVAYASSGGGEHGGAERPVPPTPPPTPATSPAAAESQLPSLAYPAIATPAFPYEAGDADHDAATPPANTDAPQAPFFDGLLIPGSPLSPSARLGSPQQAQQQQQPQQASPPPPRPPPPVPSPGYTVKRACQPSDRRAPNNAVQRFYSIERDDIGLTEFRLRSVSDVPRIGACALCDPENWTFHGSQYDPFLTLLYAERDGCIPSSVVTTYPKFIVPWRYKNKRTGEITWKIFHLSGDKITSADSETIIVNPSKDLRLRRVMRRAAAIKSKFQGQDVERVEYLLRIVRETLGDYGLPGGPSSAEADARLFQQMLNQGHNLMLLCDVEIGLCRHKALLFKILCDVIDLNCALVTGYSTAGRHQWNIITIPNKGNFLIDPTSPHFTWTTKGSHRTRGYRVTADTSFGHSGFTQKEAGIF